PLRDIRHILPWTDHGSPPDKRGSGEELSKPQANISSPLMRQCPFSYAHLATPHGHLATNKVQVDFRFVKAKSAFFEGVGLLSHGPPAQPRSGRNQPQVSDGGGGGGRRPRFSRGTSGS